MIFLKDNLKLITGLSIFLLILSFWVLRNNNSSSVLTKELETDFIEVEALATTEASVGKEALLIYVDVKGEVENPGVYQMSANDRVHNVIARAGGFTDEADQTSVNLAQKVFDEMAIIIFSKNDQSFNMTENASFHHSRIRVNYASKQDLEKLPGIGAQKASAIIEYREKNGYFKEISELLNVTGIGEATLAKFRDQIMIP